MRTKLLEPFVVKEYYGERPSIKGNGFDGLEVGEDRDEAENFLAFVNVLIQEHNDAAAERANKE